MVRPGILPPGPGFYDRYARGFTCQIWDGCQTGSLTEPGPSCGPGRPPPAASWRYPSRLLCRDHFKHLQRPPLRHSCRADTSLGSLRGTPVVCDLLLHLGGHPRGGSPGGTEVSVATKCVGIPGGVAMSPGGPGGRLVGTYITKHHKRYQSAAHCRAQKRSATGLTSRD